MDVHLTPEIEQTLAALTAQTGRAPEALIADALAGYAAVAAPATLDWSRCPVVESVPGKVSGAWVLKNTRMPVATIFENLEAGASLDNIMEWFDGLDRAQVKAVIAFAARSLDTPALER
jgi:uncharacterized protein (DUF433 family)